jgi:hypothetical protein
MNHKYIFIVIIILIIIYLYKHNEEYFITYYDDNLGFDQRYCKSCDDKTILNCGECNNCGICIQGNISKCISGDIDGPSNKVKCDKWIYGSNNSINYVAPRVPFYYNYYYPYYFDMFYPPYYYDGIYYSRGYSRGYNRGYNKKYNNIVRKYKKSNRIINKK